MAIIKAVSFLTLSSVFLGGCSTFSADGGMQDVSAMTRERVGHPVSIQAAGSGEVLRSAVNGLLASPLTPDTAVQVALLNNPGLQASLAELGIAESDLVQAGRMRNPGFGFGRMRGGEDVEIERSVAIDLVGLLTIPLRRGIEARRFEQAKALAALQAVQLASQTRKAYFNAVSAEQSALYMAQVAAGAEASAELAARMTKVGNLSKLDQAREQAFYADATTQVARARHNVTASREQLARLLGVWGDQANFRLPSRLPDLPDMLIVAADLENDALQKRLDVAIAKRDVESSASTLGLTRTTGFINALDFGYTNKSETGKPRANGYEISIEIPLFDWGGARTAKAQAVYMQSVHRVADTAVRARTEVRESYSAYRTTYDIARHYRDEVVPVRKKISDEVLLRYNGMLMSVFELLADSRAQVNSVNAAIEAQREFWLAESDLQSALYGSGSGSTAMRTKTDAAEAPQKH
ncbi:MAG: TolC family protein [Pseudomonadota bacterium]